MTIQQMKDAIVRVYDTTSWKKKVENMYDDQVLAIYHNFRERGILDKTLKRERPGTAEAREARENCEQMSFLNLL